MASAQQQQQQQQVELIIEIDSDYRTTITPVVVRQPKQQQPPTRPQGTNAADVSFTLSRHKEADELHDKTNEFDISVVNARVATLSKTFQNQEVVAGETLYDLPRQVNAQTGTIRPIERSTQQATQYHIKSITQEAREMLPSSPPHQKGGGGQAPSELPFDIGAVPIPRQPTGLVVLKTPKGTQANTNVGMQGAKGGVSEEQQKQLNYYKQLVEITARAVLSLNKSLSNLNNLPDSVRELVTAFDRDQENFISKPLEALNNPTTVGDAVKDAIAITIALAQNYAVALESGSASTSTTGSSSDYNQFPPTTTTTGEEEAGGAPPPPPPAPPMPDNFLAATTNPRLVIVTNPNAPKIGGAAKQETVQELLAKELKVRVVENEKRGGGGGPTIDEQLAAKKKGAEALGGKTPQQQAKGAAAAAAENKNPLILDASVSALLSRLVKADTKEKYEPSAQDVAHRNLDARAVYPTSAVADRMPASNSTEDLPGPIYEQLMNATPIFENVLRTIEVALASVLDNSWRTLDASIRTKIVEQMQPLLADYIKATSSSDPLLDGSRFFWAQPQTNEDSFNKSLYPELASEYKREQYVGLFAQIVGIHARTILQYLLPQQQQTEVPDTLVGKTVAHVSSQVSNSTRIADWSPMMDDLWRFLFFMGLPEHVDRFFVGGYVFSKDLPQKDKKRSTTIVPQSKITELLRRSPQVQSILSDKPTATIIILLREASHGSQGPQGPQGPIVARQIEEQKLLLRRAFVSQSSELVTLEVLRVDDAQLEKLSANPRNEPPSLQKLIGQFVTLAEAYYNKCLAAVQTLISKEQSLADYFQHSVPLHSWLAYRLFGAQGAVLHRYVASQIRTPFMNSLAPAVERVKASVTKRKAQELIRARQLAAENPTQQKKGAQGHFFDELGDVIQGTRDTETLEYNSETGEFVYARDIKHLTTFAPRGPHDFQLVVQQQCRACLAPLYSEHGYYHDPRSGVAVCSVQCAELLQEMTTDF